MRMNKQQLREIDFLRAANQIGLRVIFGATLAAGALNAAVLMVPDAPRETKAFVISSAIFTLAWTIGWTVSSGLPRYTTPRYPYGQQLLNVLQSLKNPAPR
jgi:hypothetical protein